jgi:hypothetical protein
MYKVSTAHKHQTAICKTQGNYYPFLDLVGATYMRPEFGYYVHEQGLGLKGREG